jgi:hypothetical protein
VIERMLRNMIRVLSILWYSTPEKKHVAHDQDLTRGPNHDRTMGCVLYQRAS